MSYFFKLDHSYKDIFQAKLFPNIGSAKLHNPLSQADWIQTATGRHRCKTDGELWIIQCSFPALSVATLLTLLHAVFMHGLMVDFMVTRALSLYNTNGQQPSCLWYRIGPPQSLWIHKCNGLMTVSPLIMCQMLCNQTGGEVAGATFMHFCVTLATVGLCCLVTSRNAYLWISRVQRVTEKRRRVCLMLHLNVISVPIL